MNGLPVKKRVFVGILDPKQFNSAVALTSRLSGTCYRTVRRWQSLRIAVSALNFTPQFRSEERRVGKECRSRWSPYH